MFAGDGIVYADEMTDSLKVCDARIVNDYCMLVTFSTGEVRLFDATVLFGMPVFEPLRDRAVFDSFTVDHGFLTWLGGSIDIAPEALYEESFRYDVSA